MESKGSIVLTSRIRLARNISGIPFPHMLSLNRSEEVIDEIYSSIIDNEVNLENSFKLIKLNKINPLQRLSLVEKHLISKEHANNYEIAGVLLNDSNNISIMINEEDHIRLQVMENNFNLKEIYETAIKIDDVIEAKLNYAFDSKLGYLTSCPTNLGTGIRASVMVHLPALTLVKNINNIIETVNQVGMTIRGFYGEDSNAMGNIYQISNQITLGLSEYEIINNIVGVTKKIIDNERTARNLIMKKQALELEDDIYRSLGMLRYTRLITTSECLNLLSKVRMGVELGIINDIDIKKLDMLFVNVQPATIQLENGQELDDRGRDIARAKIVRETLSNII
jgi:protein arginine kinase